MRKSAAILIFLAATTMHAQFGVYTFTAKDSTSGAISGFVAFVDATMTNVVPTATAQLLANDPCRLEGFPVRLTTTIDFASALNAPFAINANLGPGMADAIYDQRPCGTPYGLLKSGGSFLAAVDQLGPLPTYGPSLIFPLAGLPVIGANPPQQSIGASVAIAGWIGAQGASTCITVNQKCQCQGTPPGTLLVAGGSNSGSTAQPVPAETAPRTGAGLDSTGKILMFFVVNGNEGGGTGLSLPDFADLMIAFGVQNGINLDGGGSSTFAWNPNAVNNQPSVLVTNAVNGVKQSHGSISYVSLSDATSSPCYSYPHALPQTPICQPKPVISSTNPYRPIYANFGYVLAGAGAKRK